MANKVRFDMISKWQWLLAQLTRMLWVRASLFALLAVLAALLATAADRVMPEGLPLSIGAESVEPILNILASSMLTVTTFSLTVMVSAYAAATTSVTPRGVRLLMQDTTTQNVLGTFLGSFLFSLVAIIALSTNAYGERGRIVLFAFTLLVILIIVVTMLRWIDHLSRFGRVGDTTDRVEQATLAALQNRVDNPCMGARPWLDGVLPADVVPIYADCVGYVQHVDVEKLQEAVATQDLQVHVTTLPGGFVDAGRALAWVGAAADVQTRNELSAAFTVGKERSFDQDPRFGLAVLAEIASRALSPAMNDPGTAIDVVGRGVRTLSCWPADPGTVLSKAIHYPQVSVPPLALGDLFDDVFAPIARDGASLLEVQSRLQKAYAGLAAKGGSFQAEAQRHAALALKRAETAMTLEEDLARVRALAAPLVS
ncbi:Uncharacterized membrane protein [Halopseudomonas sabulinigri]|uniref:Uncharacterized membrane protein n=2 Tax=Halopseudomonas sabulinigri TaxID=472181 RepID=A0A1H1UEW0_9GAMM|nr:Uncharacterized membrane protein [Halopseudomonas sabulinigri]